MTLAPPLGHVTGSIELAEVFGGFGPVAGSIIWLGACVGGCGSRPGCREDYPQPECSGCGRARHGITHDGGAIGRIVPVPARILPGELPVEQPVNEPVEQPVEDSPQVTVLRGAREISACDPSIPDGLRKLIRIADEHGRPVKVTAAIADRPDKGLCATLALRVRGVGVAVYERSDAGSWAFSTAVVAAPELRRANVGRFTAAVMGVDYVPPPRPEVERRRGACPGCGVEVSLTKDGAVYASHKCRTGGTEGRS